MWPRVSVIIPARNGGARLDSVLRACAAQDYPGEREIIVVDNGSTDDTPQVTARHEGVILLEERQFPGSPYSARNRGLEVATGEIIVLLDATCVPCPDWLTQGVLAMQAIGRGMAAGAIVFSFSRQPPAAGELWDSVTNVQQDQAVRRGVAKTGNLFVHAALFEAMGPFREGVRSGEDVRWTGDATAAGWPLVYAEHARVEYRARAGEALLRKAARTGAGKARQMGLPGRLARGAGYVVVPPSPWKVRRLLGSHARPARDRALLLRVWLVAWSVRAAHGLGLLFRSALGRAD
jgi:glycosyltransferase AglE